VAPGNFIFGYAKVAGGTPPQLAIDSRRITDNGSLLVFRRLAQDVLAFRKFYTDQAQALQPQWVGLQVPQLASLIVGRWPSGAPAHPAVTTDPGVVNDDPDNSFDFHGDLVGALCPLGAHIRKVNPRKGPADVVDVPRILRRGIPFGPTLDIEPTAERGLLFLAYQSSIQNAFEFINGHWMNSHNRPGLGDDILIGRPFDSRTMQIVGPTGAVTVSTNGQQWIRPTGGAYLFAPSKSGLGRLATQPPALTQFSAHLLLARAASGLRRFIRRRRPK
jgi:deferrochelatase/peroxidase EfeB